MKFNLLLIVALALSTAINKVSAQLPAGSYGQDFTVTDQFGVSHNLYNYLDQGYTVFLDIDATWNGPGWSYLNSNALNDLYTNHGPVGAPGVSATTSDDVMVIWIDDDAGTNDADMNGVGPNTQGNWLNPTGNAPIQFPMANPAAALAGTINTDYAIGYFPTIYRICPNRIATEVGYLNGTLADASSLYATVQSCPPQAFQDNDPAILSYEGDLTTCGNTNVAVFIQNNGFSPLTACTIIVTGGIAPLVYNWTGDLTTYAVETVNVGTISLTGPSNLNIAITSADDNISNNAITAPISFAPEGTTIIQIEILFNSSPEETSWSIKDEIGNVVASADYSSGTIPEDYSTKIIDVLLPSTGCYTFTAIDAYGDGFFESQYQGGVADGYLNVVSLYSDGSVFSNLLSISGTYNFLLEQKTMNINSSGQIIPGCNNPLACNYNINDQNNLTCQYPGCTNTSACNYNANAGCDDGSCHLTYASCSDGDPNTVMDFWYNLFPGAGMECTCTGQSFQYGSVGNSNQIVCPEIQSTQISTVNDPSVEIYPLGVNSLSYSLQWYTKTGNNPVPSGSNTSGWNIIPGATASTLAVDAFTGTRTYACFVTPDASYGISGSWMSGAKVLTYSSFAAQTIIGNPNITPFNAYNYIVNPIPGNTYNWSVTNGAIASGQGTNNVSIMWGQNGPYQLTLTESDGTCSGSSYLFAVNNNCSISVSAASSTTNTFCAGTTLQLQAATSATGITYQWYLNGTLIPNETNQNISVSAGGNYQVSINQNGCTAVSNIVSINQLPSAIIPSILVEQANAGCAGGETTLTVSGGIYTNLLWNNGLTASSINVNASGDFSITAIDENGCAVSAGPVSVNFSILDPVPVCIVTVDQVTGKNNVVWEPVTSDLINSYVVLKETNVANEYAQIGTVAYGSNGIFEDLNSDPQIQANRYKLALIDTCGILSSTSNFHKTIHLTANQGLGSNVNLIWSDYEGFDFGSYSIYRGSSASSLNLLTTIASNLNSFTDVNPPVGETYYMIEVAGVSCDPQRTLVYSHSNILDSTVGIEEFTSTRISLYPNPASTSITLQVNTSLLGEEYVVFDAIGKVIYKNKIQSTNELIHLENFNNGNYFIKVNEVVKRFVVQH